jgi:hypothetical protein
MRPPIDVVVNPKDTGRPPLGRTVSGDVPRPDHRSTDGLGLMAGQLLSGQGHAVTLHARNASRADDDRAALPGAEGVVVGDLSTLAGMRAVARR